MALPDRRPRHALIVEPDDSIAAALHYILTREGLTVLRLDRGADLLAALRNLHPSLVLIDLRDAGGSCTTLCEDIRRDPGLRGLRVVMMTARGSARERQAALRQGADGTLPKPFDLADLRAELARLG